MQIYQIQKRKTYSHWLLVGPATDRRHVLYMYRLDCDLRTVYNVCMAGCIVPCGMGSNGVKAKVL